MAVARRRFLGTVAGGSLALTPQGRVVEAMQSSRDVFAHGVASGDPLEDRVFRWKTGSYCGHVSQEVVVMLRCTGGLRTTQRCGRVLGAGQL